LAAAGYRLLDRFRFDTAILVGPSHFASFPGASVWASGAFETPLGRVAIDEATAAAILERDPQLEFLPRPHEIEHSLEMQLPFLQVLAPEMAIVPVLMGGQSRGEVDRVAEAVASAVARATGRILLIASSDLSHYLPAETAAQLDGLVLEQLNHFEPDRLMDLFERSPNHACGAGPMVAVLKAARQLGGQGARVLRYGDSGDVTGDKNSVVGYLSAAVFGKE
jgi:AmmeMemoRadiSam system protein B